MNGKHEGCDKGAKAFVAWAIANSAERITTRNTLRGVLEAVRK